MPRWGKAKLRSPRQIKTNSNFCACTTVCFLVRQTGTSRNGFMLINGVFDCSREFPRPLVAKERESESLVGTPGPSADPGSFRVCVWHPVEDPDRHVVRPSSAATGSPSWPRPRLERAHRTISESLQGATRIESLLEICVRDYCDPQVELASRSHGLRSKPSRTHAIACHPSPPDTWIWEEV